MASPVISDADREAANQQYEEAERRRRATQTARLNADLPCKVCKASLPRRNFQPLNIWTLGMPSVQLVHDTCHYCVAQAATSPPPRIIQSVIVDSMCFMSFPCRHHIRITYADDTTEIRQMVSARDILREFGSHLSAPDRRHLESD